MNYIVPAIVYNLVILVINDAGNWIFNELYQRIELGFLFRNEVNKPQL